MTKLIKRYQLLQGLSLMTYFVVNGKPIQVSFSNGMRTPFLVRGRFSTDDEDLQKAIESSNGFNVQYRLEHVDGGEEETQEETPVAPEVDNTPLVDDASGDPNAETPKGEAPSTEDDTPPSGETTEADKENIPPKEDVPATDIPPALPVDYPEVKTVKDARQKLLDLYPDELKPAQLPNKIAVLARAKDKQITFSNLV